MATPHSYLPSHSHSHSKDCKSCHLPITDGQAYKLGTDQWHVPCFKCSKCSKSLGVDSNFLVLGTGALVCSDCSYTCKSCGKKIYDLAILTGDLAYCADCFKCKSCNKPIDDLKYARTSKGLFCMPCHHMLMEKKKKYEKMKQKKKAREDAIKQMNENLNSGSEMTTLDISLKDTNSSTNTDLTAIDSNDSKSKSTTSVPTTSKATITTLKSPSKRNTNRDSIILKPNFNIINSSSSTFDVDDYAEPSDLRDDNGSSVYSSKEGDESIFKVDERKSSVVVSIGPSLDKVDSSPIEKLDVALGFEVKSPNIKNTSYSIFTNPDENNTSSAAVDIPTLKPNEDIFSQTYKENEVSDISIPLRSPRRSALSPVRNTTQFRTPELATPQKKQTPKENKISPSGLNRHGFIIENNEEREPDQENEAEPESFINLDETEEESLMSVTESEEHIPLDKSENPALLSPMKYNNSSKPSNDHESIGLNIQGLQTRSTSEVINSQSKSSINVSNIVSINASPSEKILNTPEQQSVLSFEDKTTPRRKQIGGLGRSLTKVFARSKHNDIKEPILEQPSTPETLKGSPSLNNFNSERGHITPRQHVRTRSDHSYVAFTTPPIPPSTKSYHSRSASESTTFDVHDQVNSTEKELQTLKTEINSLTLSKAKILKDIQLLVTQMKSLQSDITDRQKTLKDLDLQIENKRKFSNVGSDDISSSNLSNSSVNEINGYKTTLSSDNLISNDHFVSPPQIGQQQSNPLISTSPNSASASAGSNSSNFNPYNQTMGSASSQSKDKRSGFMRRIFGAHNNGTPGGQSMPNSASSIKTVGSISQPMNVRYNEEQMNYNESLSKTNENGSSHLSGMKPSRSTNFMQWRSNQSSATSNTSNDTSNNHRSLYSMTIQELVDYEGSAGIPFIIKTCILEVEKRGSKVEGIYRISASTSTVEKIEQFFDIMNINNNADISKMHSVIDADIHALAGLLKRYLKKIPDPIIPQELYSAYIQISTFEDEKIKLDKLNDIINELPKANKITLLALVKHLALIAENEKWTKMSSGALATVFAPTLVRHNSLHPQEEIQDNRAKTLVTELLFKNYRLIFNIA